MIKKIKENMVFSNNYYKVFNDDVEFNGTHIGTHIKVEPAKSQDGIAVLPVLKNGNILLIKNYRYSVDDFVYQAVKGGNGTKFTDQSVALQCVKEEMEEEINKFSNEILFINSYYESPSIFTSKGHAFIAFNCQEVTDKKHFIENTECIESIIEISVDEIDEFMKDKKSCSTTLMLIASYQKHLAKKYNCNF